jgi:hypothetical protein
LVLAVTDLVIFCCVIICVGYYNCDEPCKCSCLNLEFKIKKEGSYNYDYKRGRASAALNLIGTTLVKAPASSQKSSDIFN